VKLILFEYDKYTNTYLAVQL